MEILGKLFENSARVKLLRLFLFNSEAVFHTDDLRTRAKVTTPLLRRELALLKRIGLIKQKRGYREVTLGRKGKERIVRKQFSGYVVDESFTYYTQLQQFLFETMLTDTKTLLGHLRKVGRLSVVVISGVFIRDWDARIDLLVVGDRLNDRKLSAAIKNIEAEMGREVRYAAFTTSDFRYRMGMRDRLIRDILDFPHENLIDRASLLP